MGRVYLSIFLLRIGLLTLITVDSFIVLAKSCLSLSIMLMLSSVVMWPVAEGGHIKVNVL